jgi:methionine-rich copper-binding protein CopC
MGLGLDYCQKIVEISYLMKPKRRDIMKKLFMISLSIFLAVVLISFAGCKKTTSTTTTTANTTTNVNTTSTVSTTSVISTTFPIQNIVTPLLSNTDPGYQDTNVPINQLITATFSEPMNPSTITVNSFTLWQGTSPVPHTVSYYGNTAILNPSNDLAKTTMYTAKISTDVTDLSGNHLLNDFSFSFTTGLADTVAPAVVSTIPSFLTVNPNNPDNPFGSATNVPVNDAITAYFSEGMDPSTINTTTFTLMQGTTPVTGKVTSDGFETAVFTPAGALSPNTQYTATITTGVACLGGNTLPKNFVWSFTTGAPQATVPMVLSTVPVAGDGNVPINDSITATFSEAVNPITINSANFSLWQGGVNVPAAVTFDGVNTAVLTPLDDLLINTTYNVQITTGVTDLAGIPLGAAVTWTFTTGAADTSVPTITSMSPANGATLVAVTSTITATFSEKIDPSSIVFSLMQGTTMVPGSIVYDSSTKMVTITPGTALAANTMYTVSISASDLAGFGPAAATWSFTTAQ